MQITPASEFKKTTRKLYQLPSGRVVEIRKLGLKDISELGIFPPGFAGMSDEARQEHYEGIKNDPDKNLAVFDRVIAAGVTRPVVKCGPVQEVAEEEVHVTDLGDDAPDLFLAVLSFSTGVPQERLRGALSALNPD